MRTGEEQAAPLISSLSKHKLGYMTEVDAPLIRVRQGAVFPKYVHGPEEDAGLDLHYCGDGPAILRSGGWHLCPTGIAIALPPGFEGQIRPRSGLALEKGITVLNAPGTIDPGYRGEICVILINLGPVEQMIMPGDRIAQLVVGEYAHIRLYETDHLDSANRGSGGFGSTGY